MLNATPATITEDSGFASSGQHVKFTSASGFGNTAPAHAAKTLTQPRREETALNRLIRDLTLSVPTVLLVTTYYPVCTAIRLGLSPKPPMDTDHALLHLDIAS